MDEEQSRESREKYERGVKEHGGNMWEHDQLWFVEESIKEAIDLLHYLRTLRQKMLDVAK